MISRSPQRGQFHIDNQLKQVEDGTTTAEEAEGMIDFYKSWEQRRLELEETEEWKINNMEYDLRTTDWILEKVRSDEAYAQNLYAAMCNNEFRKVDVVEILKESSWGCSWRSAGGIIANMREQGDYIDWYCSGIKGDPPTEEEFNAMTPEQQSRAKAYDAWVSESVVTDEIRSDLLKLGWIVLDDENDNF